MAITTEPGLRVQRSKDITHEDYLDAIDRILPAQTPLLSFCQNEVKLKAIDRQWNVDSFPAPKGALGRADGEAAPGSGSALSRDWSAAIRKMGNIAQAFTETWRVGWIAGQVPQIAGVADVNAYSKAGALLALKQHKEVAFCSTDQTALYDVSSSLGAVMASYFNLVASANAYSTAPSAYAIGKAPGGFAAPSAAVLTGAMSAVHNRAMWKAVSLALRQVAKQHTDWMAILGLSLRQAVTDLTNPVQTTATAPSGSAFAASSDQVRVLLRNETDNVLGATVDTIQTDFGKIMVTESDYIGTTTGTDGSASGLSAWATASATRVAAVFSANLKAGIIFKRGNLFKTWGVMPFTQLLAPDGGGDYYDTKELCLLGIRNPSIAGTLNLT